MLGNNSKGQVCDEAFGRFMAEGAACNLPYWSCTTGYCLAPLATPNLTVTEVSPTTVNLTWDPVTGAGGYVVSYGTNPANLASQLHVTSPGATVTGLSPLLEYSFTVAAETVCGNGVIEVGEACDHAGAPNSCCAPDCGAFLPMGALCRSATDVCDLDDVCSGSSAACPNTQATNGTSCGKNQWACSAGVCLSPIATPANFTVTEVSPTTVSLSWDPVAGATAYMVSFAKGSADPTNRRGAGAATNMVITGLDPLAQYSFSVEGTINECGDGRVDAGELCDGGGWEESCCTTGCSGVLPAGTTCRMAQGICDVADSCDGVSGTCSDAVVPPGIECLAAAGTCDVADTCDGVTKLCPPKFVAASTLCRAATGICDAAESCTGAAPNCPVDLAAPYYTVCRASTDACDRVEYCAGSMTCPVDGVMAGGALCRSANGACDRPEICDGTSKACPTTDLKYPAGTVCRAVSQQCDSAESCDGASNGCPADTGVDPACVGVCPNGTCETAESCTSCAQDCGACPFCGDGSCQRENSENCASCAQDCGACPAVFCGDGTCQGTDGESCTTCESDCMSCGAPVAWQNVLGVNVGGSSLTKTAITGFDNAGASSVTSVPAGDCFLEFSSAEDFTYKAIGLANGDSNYEFADIDFGLYLIYDQVLVIESGINRGAVGPYDAGDVFRIELTEGGKQVRYTRNGTVLYESWDLSPSYPLLVDTALITSGATLDNVKLVKGLCGNGICDTGSETCATCAADCSTCTACGNGVVDTGEVCDHGGRLDSCCNPSCSGVKGTATVCRPAQVSCDVAEVCDGSTAECPGDDGDCAPAVPIAFSNATGVDVQGNSVTKNLGLVDDWGVAGAASADEITGSGFIELAFTELSTQRAAGLASGDTSVDLDDIDFGFLVDKDNELQIHEAGVPIKNFGPYTAGERLRIEVAAGTVRYLRGGSLLFTSSKTPVFPLRVDTAFNSPGGDVEEVVLLSDTTTGFFTNANTKLVDIVDTGSTKELTKRAGAGKKWNVGAISSESFLGGGYLEFSTGEVTTDKAAGLGGVDDTNQGKKDIDFGFWLKKDGTAIISEKDTKKHGPFTYAAGDGFKVERVSGQVRYYHRGVQLPYTGTSAATTPLVVDISLMTEGATIKGIVLVDVVQDDGACEAKHGETCGTADCGACPYCGDGTCNGDDTPGLCQGDCGGPDAVTWTSVVGCKVGANGNDLTKDGADNKWDSGAVSAQSVLAGQASSLEFATLGTMNPSFTDMLVGLTSSPVITSSTKDPPPIDFGLRLTGTNVSVLEEGSAAQPVGSFTAGTRFRITVATDGNVKYEKSGDGVTWTLLYDTPKNATTFPLFAQASMRKKKTSGGSAITNVKFVIPPCGNGVLDLGELCDRSGCCAANCTGYLQLDTPCRDAAPGDLCDVTEKCSGQSDACPVDEVYGSRHVCRLAGACDIPEYCDGVKKTCPIDDYIQPAGAVCGVAQGVCDLPEKCDGLTKVCPADGGKRPTTDECRPAAGSCDVAEYCTGTNDCPLTDVKKSANWYGAIVNWDGSLGAYCDGDSAAPARATGQGCPADNASTFDYVNFGAGCSGVARQCPPITPCVVGYSADGSCTPTHSVAGTPCDDGLPCSPGGTCDGFGNCL